MSDSYSLRKCVYLRNKLLHRQNKHQSNILMLMLIYQLIFIFFLYFYQTICHNLIFGVYPYLLVLLHKFGFFLNETVEFIHLYYFYSLVCSIFGLYFFRIFFIQYKHIFLLIPSILPTALPLFPSIYNFIACFFTSSL